MNITKKIVDGNVAVLISPGFGAGWSTWANDTLRDFTLFDSGLVDLAERNAPLDEVDAYVKSRIGDRYLYMGGWNQVGVRWLPVGTQFTVEEYDGSESLRLVSDLSIIA